MRPQADTPPVALSVSALGSTCILKVKAQAVIPLMTEDVVLFWSGISTGSVFVCFGLLKDTVLLTILRTDRGQKHRTGGFSMTW